MGIAICLSLILSAYRDENEPATITDPDAVKPEDWLEDEPSLLPDPEATKPADWCAVVIATKISNSLYPL